MLQAINAVHTFSMLNPSLYFGFLALLACIVCPGWYTFGRLQLASVSPAPIVPARQCPTLFLKGLSLVLQFRGLLLLSSLEVRTDAIALVIAAKAT